LSEDFLISNVSLANFENEELLATNSDGLPVYSKKNFGVAFQ
jgi:hypothetical protein